MRAFAIAGAYSFVPLHVTALINNTPLGTATAFAYSHGGITHIVTNWHVVSGRNPTNGNLLHTKAGAPNRLRIWFHDRHNLGKWVDVSTGLYKDRVPTWLEHPVHGHAVDVVVLPIAMLELVACHPVNEQDDDSFTLLPGQDVFVLGFPEGFTSGGHLPIWKRGSLATEPDVDVGGLPKMLIDTATRKGMSGAPVIAQVSGMWFPEGASKDTDAKFGRAGQRFVGIYSSREGDDETKVQLGVVWKASVIREIIEGGACGKNPHPDNEYLFPK